MKSDFEMACQEDVGPSSLEDLKVGKVSLTTYAVRSLMIWVVEQPKHSVESRRALLSKSEHEPIVGSCTKASANDPRCNDRLGRCLPRCPELGPPAHTYPEGVTDRKDSKMI